ncbi:DUF418 domain-containing protein [Nocardia nova]|uniref:DUF418 domain-containing protein n=1 Tax=Nocardia nova TaxID=37330 RepID=UPI0033F09505
MSQQRANVTAAATRIQDVDALRGFALFGIFVVNVTFMASAFPGNLVDDPAFDSPLDDVARFVLSALFSMKFYLLFSFLFGYSFTLQMAAARRAGADFVPRMRRRILGLFLLGVLNIVALYSGDVLTTYAVACLILLAMYRVRDSTALRVAGGLYALVLISLASALLVDRSSFMPGHSEALANASEQTRTMRGSLAEVIGQHFDGLGLLVIQAVSMQGPTALAMFLLGMVAGRRGLLRNLDGTEPILRRMQIAGFPVGLAGGVAYAALGGDTDTTAVAVSVVTAPFLTAAYAATLLRAIHSRRGRRLTGALAPAGRMALTNYLMQSLIGLLLFTGLGFGLAGKMGPPALFLVAIAVFVFQTALSAVWLTRHRYGPVEWLLRWLTNLQRPEWGTTPRLG